MTASEVEDWLSYERDCEPISDIRWNTNNAAQLCAVIARCSGNKLDINDFLPEWAKPPKPTARQMWEKARSLFSAAGLMRTAKQNGNSADR